MNFLTLVTVGRDCLDRLSYRLQADSSLKRGIDLLKQYYDQPLKTLMGGLCVRQVYEECEEDVDEVIDEDSGYSMDS